MFKDMIFRIHGNAVTAPAHVRLQRVEEQPEDAEGGEGAAAADAGEAAEEGAEGLAFDGQEDAETEAPAASLEPGESFEETPAEEPPRHVNGVKVGRNAPCPCGSGK